jgi:hypothetical protein
MKALLALIFTLGLSFFGYNFSFEDIDLNRTFVSDTTRLNIKLRICEIKLREKERQKLAEKENRDSVKRMRH